jgi:hypothetical protein
MQCLSGLKVVYSASRTLVVVRGGRDPTIRVATDCSDPPVGLV